jgi:PASTA domain-containing protein
MKLVAVLTAVAFPFITAAAHADAMSAGTWEGQITGGTLSLGDGDLHTLPVPTGLPFKLTIPTDATGPVAFTAPGIHVPIPLSSVTDAGTNYSASGNLDVSPLSGTIDPATGSVSATGSAHGVLRLDASAVGSSATNSIWCHIGGDPVPAQSPAPFDLTLAGGSSLTADPFDVDVDCGGLVSPGTDLKIVGHIPMPVAGNALTLTTKFTRVPDPKPQVITKTQVVTVTKVVQAPPAPVKCVVPKLKGLKLKQARKAAKAANCVVGKVKRKKSGRRATTVLKQGSKAGAVLAEGSKIALTVAR